MSNITKQKLGQTINLNVLGDEKGSLIALEENKNIPFDIKRVYYIYGTKKHIRRGFHAHKNLTQVLICINGSCKVLLDDFQKKEIHELNSPDKGLTIDSMIWREMYDFSDNCILMVVANDFYNEDDYIRNYTDFISFITNNKK